MCRKSYSKSWNQSYVSFLQIVSPYNQGRSSKSSELQGKKSLRELVEMCIDVIAAEAQVIEVQKPVDQHQGQILEEEGTKYLGHACHHVSEVQYCLMKRRSRFWHDDKLMRQVRLIWIVWASFWHLQNKVDKGCLPGAQTIKDKLLKSKKELKSKGGEHERSNGDVHCEGLFSQARQ